MLSLAPLLFRRDPWAKTSFSESALKEIEARAAESFTGEEEESKSARSADAFMPLEGEGGDVGLGPRDDGGVDASLPNLIRGGVPRTAALEVAVASDWESALLAHCTACKLTWP